MALALKVLSVDRTRRKKLVIYEPTFSSSYAVGGDTADLTAATNPGLKEAVYPGAELPERLFVENAAGGLGFAFVPGTLNSNHKLKVNDGAGEIAFSPSDLKGATAPAGTEENADQAAGPVNAALIGAEETFTTIGEDGPKSIALNDRESTGVPPAVRMASNFDSLASSPTTRAPKWAFAPHRLFL